MTTTTVDQPSVREQLAQDIARNPGQFTGVLARRYNVTEAEILRAHPAELCTELDPARCVDIIHALERLGTTMVICSNEGAILECEGRFGGYSTTMGFLNVLTDTLDMHLTPGAYKAAFALIKQPHTGGSNSYSIQFYGERGTALFKVFVLETLAKKTGEDHAAQIAAWESIRTEFALITEPQA